ncbi:MAG: hypothetical protein JWO56_254 [Acidobacteria bacterium]|nr:hypothetical protein [Acidobacteriota bacterium]
MFRRRFVALGIVASLAACGGGGGSAPGPAAIPTTAPTPTPAAGVARASFTISIPKTASQSAGRSPRFVPSGTQSIRFTLLKSDNVAVGTPAALPVSPLTATSPGCSGGASAVTCTIQIAAPVGTDIYLAEIYPSTDGSGPKSGSGTVRLSVLLNATNTAALTLAGPISSVVLSTDDTASTSDQSTMEYLTLAPNALVPFAAAHVPQSARIFVSALDTQGNQIISPDTFSAPVTLTIGTYTLAITGRLRQNVPPPPQSLAKIAVAYAFPQNAVTAASTNAGNPSVDVLSPADQTVITPLTNSTGGTLVVTATIAGTVQPRSLYFEVLPDQCPSGYTGSAPSGCVSPTPAPSPTPTPTPTPVPLAWLNAPASPVPNFAADGTGNATWQAAWDPAQTFTPYELQVNTNGIARTVTVNGLACAPAIAAISGSPASSPSPTMSATPNPANYIVTATNAADPNFFFYVANAPPAQTCTITAADNAGHSVNLFFQLTTGSITVQRRTHQ